MPKLDEARLVSRLEPLAADTLRQLTLAARAAGPCPRADVLELSGGVVAYIEPGCPLNHAVCLGVSLPLEQADIEAVESFYDDRGERALISACRAKSVDVADTLIELGWETVGCEHVLVRSLSPHDRFEPVEGVEDVEIVEAVTPEDRDTWAMVAASGFSAPLAPLPEQLRIGHLVATSSSHLFLAYLQGRIAGAGELSIREGVGWLSADTTLPAFRRRGVQAALQRARLSAAVRQTCTTAVSEAVPGGSSQRNMERLGFAVAYTRMDLQPPSTRGGQG